MIRLHFKISATFGEHLELIWLDFSFVNSVNPEIIHPWITSDRWLEREIPCPGSQVDDITKYDMS